MWTSELFKMASCLSAVSAINTSDGARPSSYTYNFRFDNLSSSLLFFDPDKVLDALRYCILCSSALLVGTDPVMTSRTSHRCGKVNWSSMPVRDRSLSFDFQSGEVSD